MKKSLLVVWSVVAALAFVLNGCVKPVPPSLEVNPTEVSSVPAEGGDYTLQVTTNQPSWKVVSDSEWVTVSQKESEMVVSVFENFEQQPREAKLTVSCYDEAGVEALKLEVKVSQLKADDPTLELTPSEVKDVIAAGGTYKVEVSTNQTSWEASTEASWITISTAMNSFSIAVAEYEGVEDRKGEVVVKAISRTGEVAITKTVSVTQLKPNYKALDADGKNANCYVVSEAGSYYFNATVKGNGKGGEGLDAPAATEVKGAKLLWQTTKGMISAVSLFEGGNILFTTDGTPGNAVIAAVDANDVVVWSWHIWIPKEEIKELKMASGSTIMSLNLGSLSSVPTEVDSYGMLYQWGRKDPFTNSPTINGTTSTLPVVVYDINGQEVKMGYSSWYSVANNTYQYSVENPTVVLSNYGQYAKSLDWLANGTSVDGLWGNPNGGKKEGTEFPNKGTKTYNDPCPAGWRVPDAGIFSSFTTSGGYSWEFGQFNVVDVNNDGSVNLDDYTNGWVFYLDADNNVTSFFPAGCRYDGSYAMLMGSMAGYWGNYWTNAPEFEGTKGRACVGLAYQIKSQALTEMITMSPAAIGGRADAYSIRCVKE